MLVGVRTRNTTSWSTCGPTSLRTTSEAVHGVAGVLPGLLPTDVADLRVMEGLEAVEHLFRVTCGLDSRVVGEPQVLGQVRRASVLARDMGSSGPALANVFGQRPATSRLKGGGYPIRLTCSMASRSILGMAGP